jgi:hypothetical protein
MATDISRFLNSPQLAAAKVEPRGSGWRAAARQQSSPLATLIAPLVVRLMLGPKPELGGAQTPAFAGWAGRKRTGWRASRRPPAAKPNWPTSHQRAPTPGCAARPPPGCAAPDQPASRETGWPSRTGSSLTATGGAP